MKLSHKAVEYGPGHPKGDHCAVCKHFIANGPHCSIVADPIKPMGWCSRFKTDRAQQMLKRGRISRGAYERIALKRGR